MQEVSSGPLSKSSCIANARTPVDDSALVVRDGDARSGDDRHGDGLSGSGSFVGSRGQVAIRLKAIQRLLAHRTHVLHRLVLVHTELEPVAATVEGHDVEDALTGAQQVLLDRVGLPPVGESFLQITGLGGLPPPQHGEDSRSDSRDRERDTHSCLLRQ